MKFSSRDLNHNSCPLHLTNIYTCRVTTAPRVCGGDVTLILKHAYIYIYIYWGSLSFVVSTVDLKKIN